MNTTRDAAPELQWIVLRATRTTLMSPGAAPVFAQDYTTVDAQVSYNWPDLGLSVVLSGNNLTDEESVSSYAVPGTLGEVRTFGRQFYLGVNYQY